MISVPIKLSGISGTPTKGGNCDTVVQEALKSAAQVPGVDQVAVLLGNHMDYAILGVKGVRWRVRN